MQLKTLELHLQQPQPQLQQHLVQQQVEHQYLVLPQPHQPQQRLQVHHPEGQLQQPQQQPLQQLVHHQ